MRLKATRARLPALSMSSRQSRMTSGFRRVSTPPAPMQKISAETVRYQPMAMRLPASLVLGGAHDLVLLTADHLGLWRCRLGHARTGGLGHGSGVGGPGHAHAE